MTVENRTPLEPWIPAGPALLFCPADRPERYGKALDRADMVILDLEDAVAPGNKESARQALVENPVDPERVIVRINAAGTPDHDRDLATLGQTPYRLVMQAKTEDPAEVTAHGFATIALIETPMGAIRAEEIVAAPNCVGLMWGAEDLVAGLGGSSSRRGDAESEPGTYRDVPKYVRARVRLAAGAYRKAAVDAIHADIDDVTGLIAEVRDAVALGYTATACIHPSQAAHIRDGYAPAPERVDWAHRVLEHAAEHDGGVFALDGDMIDGPIIAQARATLIRAGQRPTD